MKNEYGVRYRFIERDYWTVKIKAESPYIAEDEINDILNEQPDLQDVTMIFIPYKSGFASQLICNHTNTKITLDDLNLAAFDFYIQQSTVISVTQAKARIESQKAEESIKTIREMLFNNKQHRSKNKYQKAQ